jgi:hypothetical protein
MMKTTKKVSGNGRYFLTLKVSDDVIKFVSVREISKIIVNKSRLEITVLLVSGDKDTVRFQSLEDLERAFSRIYTLYSSVFLAP